MMRQIVTKDANGRTLVTYRDEGPRVCRPHIRTQTVLQNGVPVRIPVGGRTRNVGRDS